MQRKFIGIITVLIIAFSSLFLLIKGIEGRKSKTSDYYVEKLFRESLTLKRRHLDLVDPNQAPNSIKYYTLRGYKIIIDTQNNAKEYVGNKLNCTNCHFAGGDTTGGIAGSISLMGVAAKYPCYNEGKKTVMDLAARVNSCFKFSMNGKPLPLDSIEMLSIVTYLQWISKGVPIYGNTPWLGLKPLKSKHEGSEIEGKRVYDVYCALCHRDDGQGGSTSPPLWGEFSFNHDDGMSNPKILASFIHWNMPYMDSTPVLTEEQSFDVAAYILSHPRPKYNPTIDHAE